jgi:hypothetical protein
MSGVSSVILGELFCWFFSILPRFAIVFVFYTGLLHWTLPVTEDPFTVKDVASGKRRGKWFTIF